MKTQKAFAEAEKLNYALLSDPDGSAAAKFGVLMPDRPFAKRVTFVLAPGGVVRHVDTEVDAKNHGPDLVERVRELQAD